MTMVALSSKSRTHGRHIMSSSLVPLKTPETKGPMHVKSVEAQVSSGWWDVEVPAQVSPAPLECGSK
ncbi:hypothetical protein TNCV_558761 [Trichonephila clavipes]|nr:hypothetical protein TNCV_558761 [Trichonephila clavipes]